MSPAALSARIKAIARDLGFDRVGICSARPVQRREYYRQWLAAGHAGKMKYLHRHVNQRMDPASLLAGAHSVVVVGLNYRQPGPQLPDDGRPRGRIAMYAWGGDYHRVVKKKLYGLVRQVREAVGEGFGWRACVDTSPVLERELAAAAGVGWIGRNTLVLERELGSYFFLGALITTLELLPDEPMADRCGRCTRCLEACPTGALHAPYQMNASRCISYLTIELRDEIPADLKPPMGDWVFGCDICQDVCPYNRKGPFSREPRLAVRPPGPHVDLDDLLAWGPAEYDATLRGSAMRRAKLEMLHRNARIAMQNRPTTRR
jgi:epoxyqueuosine reductase